MGFQEKLNEIYKGLSGDNKKDIEYLKGQMDEYKDDENSIEIIRALSRKIFDLLPDDAKDELNRIIGNNTDTIMATVEEAKYQLKEGNPKKAEMMLRSALDSIPYEFKDDEECGYFCFSNALEVAIFSVTNKYKKTIRMATYDFASIYYYYAYSLIENRKIDEAEAALKTALKWDPVSTTIISELSEIYKIKQDYENFLYWSKKILEYADSSQMLARGYRNIAWYYSDVEKYDTAAAIYYFSRFFEESKQVNAEMFYITEQIGHLPEMPSVEKMQEIFEKEGIQYGANDLVISIAYQLSKSCLENNDKESACHYLSIVYDLTHDKQILDMLKQLGGDDINDD